MTADKKGIEVSMAEVERRAVDTMEAD